MAILRLVSVESGQVIEIQDVGSVGRQPGLEVVVEDSSVSRQHALIEHGPQGWTLTDRASANGTWLGEQRVTSAPLQDGAQVRFGRVIFRVEMPAEAGDQATELLPAVSAPARPTPIPPTPPPPPRTSAPPPAQHVPLPPTVVPGRVGPGPSPRPPARKGAAGPIAAVLLLAPVLGILLAFDFGRPGNAWLGWAALVGVALLTLLVLIGALTAVQRLWRADSQPPWPIRHAGLSALVLTLPLAPGLLLARNLISDHVAYTRARESGKALFYRVYLGDGWLHASTVRRELPRVSFEEAKRNGKAEGFRSVLRSYPDAPFKDEALTLLHRIALDEAERANSAVALRRYLSEFPTSPHTEEAREALHQRYASALEEFGKQASRSNREVSSFVRRLVAYLEDSGAGTVYMTFDAPTTARLKAVDQRLAARRVGIGETIVPIADHFGPDATGRMQQSIVRTLGKGFASIFPSDVLAIKNKEKESGAISAPTLRVRYEVEPSGRAFRSTNSSSIIKPVYVGIRVVFHAVFTIPGDSRPLRLRFSVEPPTYFTVEYRRGQGLGFGDQPSASDVYSTMAARAFDNLGERLRSAFFAKGSAAFMAATGEI